ncbi:hypothetical protein [Brevibacterium sp.]|uniref:hypothetical protein n=1 Tax=Brevibacterium sp. TaxID=1701 RepID=UPI00281259C3|nr:hypothetical protein [Brevibacterium sp.]
MNGFYRVDDDLPTDPEMSEAPSSGVPGASRHQKGEPMSDTSVSPVNELRYFESADRRGRQEPRAAAATNARAAVRELRDHLMDLPNTDARGDLLEWVACYLSLRLRCDAALGVFDGYLHAVMDPDVDLATIGEPEEGPGLEVVRTAFDKRIIAELKAVGFPDDVVGTSQEAIRHGVAIVLGGKAVGLTAVMDENAHNSSPSVGGGPGGCSDCGCGNRKPTGGEADTEGGAA